MQHAWETLEKHDELSRKATLVLLFERRRKPPAWGARPRIIVCHPGNIPSAPLRASKSRGGFDRDTVTIYRRCYLDGRDPVEIAAQFGKKNVSSVYVARFRVEKALGRYGRELYQRHLGRLFLEAA